MSLTTHMDTLNWQTKKIDKQIHDEAKRPQPNESIMHTLKHKRLKIRDEILKLRTKIMKR